MNSYLMGIIYQIPPTAAVPPETPPEKVEEMIMIKVNDIKKGESDLKVALNTTIFPQLRRICKLWTHFDHSMKHASEEVREYFLKMADNSLKELEKLMYGAINSTL